MLAGGCSRAPRKLAVCEVQGEGLESPYLDQEVILSGLVIADLEGAAPGGFMILDEDCPLAGKASRGMYISYEVGENLVDQGDQVQLRGLVQETAGETCLVADLSALEILSIDNPLPGPVNLGDHLIPPLVFGYEPWEGQLVAIPRAGLVERRGDSARLLALPQLSPDPSLQMVCFQQGSFSLGISGDLPEFAPDRLQSDHELENLVGVIRQDQDGYYLQLLNEPELRLIDQDPQERANLILEPIQYADNAPVTTKMSSTTPSPSPSPSIKPALTPSPPPSPSPTWYPVQLLITELLANPLGEEPGGEWVELYNPTGETLPLDGIKFGDEVSPEGKEGMLRFPDGYSVEGGQVLVIANQSRVFESWYGFLPNFELVDSDPRVPDMVPYTPWGRSAVKLSNTGDEALLVNPWDQVLDLIVYGNTGAGGFSPPVPAPKEGHSLERYPPGQDRDQAGDWRERSSPSPGRLDLSPPTLTPTGTGTPSLSPTCSLVPESPSATPSPGTASPSPTQSWTSTRTLPATGTPLPSATTSAVTTSTEPLNWTPSLTASEPATPSPSPTPTPMPLTATLPPNPTESATAIPELTQGGSLTPVPTATIRPTGTASPTKTSAAITATITPTGTGQSTPCLTETSPGPVTPTPGATATTIPGPVILINEVLADPDPVLGDSNGDGQISWDDDEFLELVNISGKDLDLSGWQVFDEIRLRYTFPEGVILGSGCGLVLFGGGQPTGSFGGSLVFSAGSLGLNNDGDLVTIRDRAGLLAASLSYGAEGNQNQSLTRNPDLLGPLPLVPHSEVPDAGGALFSPGTKLDQTAFETCP